MYSIGFQWIICLERQISPFVWQIFMPTTFMVALSWISFLIPPTCYPGRISLLVTIVLCLINIMTSLMQQSPESNGLNAMNCWFLICLVFVAIASLEYSILLYFMRFKITQQDEKEKVVQVATKDNMSDVKTPFSNYANLIDYYSLLSIPVLFMLTIFIYFLVYEYGMPKCETIT